MNRLSPTEESSIEILVDSIHGDLQQNIEDNDYIKNRIILATIDQRVDAMNEAVSSRLGQMVVYRSIDS
jgi:PIF1-like helicase